jgi:hypothetical protein
MLKHYKRGLGDRSDGWRIRNVDAVFNVIPFVMPRRNDSQILWGDDIDVTYLEKFIKEHKEIEGLSIMHILVTAIVRVMSQRPQINRFVIHNKIYAHNSITMCLASKKSLSDTGAESMVKTEFDPWDTLKDVTDRLNADINKTKQVENESGSDIFAKIMGFIPAFVVRFLFFLLRRLDYIGLIPKSLVDMSPFHCSFYISNLGSIGVNSVFHHLYEFGTCSLFLTMGFKKNIEHLDAEGNKVSRKTMNIKLNGDERICDGFYYGLSIRMLMKYLRDPSLLLSPPADVMTDPGVRKKRLMDQS